MLDTGQSANGEMVRAQCGISSHALTSRPQWPDGMAEVDRKILERNWRALERGLDGQAGVEEAEQ